MLQKASTMTIFSVVILLILGCLISSSDSQLIPREYELRSLLQGNTEFGHDLLASFEEFAIKYDKTYPNEGEMLYRLKVFKDRVAEAHILNEESKRLGSTATFGVTKFSELTLEEFKSQYLMTNMPPIPEEKMYPNYMEPDSSVSHLYSSKQSPPAAFDWANTTGTETPVYDQGGCGSCWAFSATENHESRYARQHNQAAQSMSVQQILDCDDPSQYGCGGGWPSQAWEYIQSQGGQDQWSCYPYVGEVQSSCNWNGGCNAGGIVSWSWIFPNDEANMLLWLWGNAPISICLDASSWNSYTGGIIMSSQCSQNTGHCVLLSGWNMNGNPSYWNVRNSWGTNWGMNGFIFLQYGANTCGMAQYSASCHTVNGRTEDW